MGLNNTKDIKIKTKAAKLRAEEIQRALEVQDTILFALVALFSKIIIYFFDNNVHGDEVATLSRTCLLLKTL